MKWFRFYSDALEDPKVQRLPGELFKTWVNLLCLANKAEQRGLLPDLDDMAFALRMDPDTLAEQLEELVRRNLLDPVDGGVTPHNWEGRQKASDNVTARVQQFRNKDKESETLPKRSSNALDKTKTRGETDQEERESILRPVAATGQGGGAAAPRQTQSSPTPLRPAPKPKDAPPLERPRDLLFEAVCDACLIDWLQLTDTERGKVNAATGQIRKAGGTPTDIPTHAAHYRLHFTTTLTPMALAGNWGLTAHAPPVPTGPPRGGGRQTVEDANMALYRRIAEQESQDEPEDVSGAIDAHWELHQGERGRPPLRSVVAEVRRPAR